MNETTRPGRPLGTRWCGIGSWIAGIAIALVLAGLAGAQLGLLSPLGAFSTFGIGVLLCVVAVAVLVIGLLLSKGSAGGIAAGRAWGALVVAGIVFGVSWISFQNTQVEGAPPIHDISTDLDYPPAFEAIVPLRAADDAQNPPEYAGEEVAAQQRDAFPDLQTLTVSEAPDAVFGAAEAAARDMGWEIVAVDPDAGRIEATDTTGWFRFRDDVVIRVAAGDGGGSAVDVRSKSRVGQGDMGTNAARIRAYLERLQARLG